MNVDVSIIVASYNIGSYVERAIQSALASQNVNAEVIVVDDCSTDNTWNILSKITDPRVKIYQQSENGGPSVARNTALSHCTGDWVAVLDGDDAFEADRLSRLKKIGEEQKADWVVDDLMIVREDDDQQYPMFGNLDQFSTLNLAAYIKGNCFGQKGHTLGYTKPFMSRQFLEQHKLRYNPDIRIGEDYIFMAEALALGAKCAVDPNAGYLYTVRSSSISHRLTPQDVTTIQDIDAAFLDKFELDKDAAKAQRKRNFSLKETYAFTVLVEAIKSKDIGGIFKAIMICPTAPRHLSEAITNRLRGRKA